MRRMYSCAIALGMLLLSEHLEAKDSVFELLVNAGVEVTPKESLKLAEPTIADGLDDDGEVVIGASNLKQIPCA